MIVINEILQRVLNLYGSRDLLDKGLAMISKREARIFLARFHKRTLRSIGEEEGVSQERVRQILYKTCKRLTVYYHNEILVTEKEGLTDAQERKETVQNVKGKGE